MDILVFIAFHFMDSTAGCDLLWLIVINCAIWSTDHKAVINLRVESWELRGCGYRPRSRSHMDPHWPGTTQPIVNEGPVGQPGSAYIRSVSHEHWSITKNAPTVFGACDRRWQSFDALKYLDVRLTVRRTPTTARQRLRLIAIDDNAEANQLIGHASLHLSTAHANNTSLQTICNTVNAAKYWSTNQLHHSLLFASGLRSRTRT